MLRGIKVQGEKVKNLVGVHFEREPPEIMCTSKFHL